MKQRIMAMVLIALGLVISHVGTPGPDGVVWAREGGVQRIADFEVPDFDSEMRLRSKLSGDYARIMPNGEVEITRMRLEFYGEDRTVEMRVTAPECLYDNTTRSARSESDIHIARKEMIITGRGFVWDAESGTFKIHNEARVLLLDMGLKGLQ